MRNDVKLGFAIGGVLLAVLVVYVLVVPGSGAKKKVALNATGKDASGKVTLEPVTPAKALPQSKPVSAPPQTFSPGAVPSRDVIGEAGASSGKSEPEHVKPAPTDPFASNTSSSESGSASAGAAGNGRAKSQKPAEVAKAGPTENDWNRILNAQPTLIAQTPVTVPAPANSNSTDSEPQTTLSQAGSGEEPSLTPTDPGISAPEPVAHSTPAAAPSGAGDVAASGGGTIHTVAAGETFSSISASAYGSANFYPAIMRANPSVDPQHLKPGMKITLPDVSQVKPSAGAAGSVQLASSRTTQTIDPKKQYRVQPGDSLYRIAVRLYGKGTYSTKLFELNQQAMGGDETRLRPGQILQLPEPPTQGQ